MTPAELDSWSATEVMGWIDHFDHYCITGSEPSGEGTVVCKIMATKETTSFGPGWHPHTDLNQCFMVVERMRELGWYGNLKWNKREGELDEPFVAVFFKKETGDLINAENINPATAICLAALKAVRGE